MNIGYLLGLVTRNGRVEPLDGYFSVNSGPIGLGVCREVKAVFG